MEDKILVPLALSDDEQPVVDRARQIAIEESKGLLLFHVVDLHQIERTLAGAELKVEDLVAHQNQLIAEKQQEAIQQLNEITGELETAGLNVKAEVWTGLPAPEIIHTAKHRADIVQVVMGTRHTPALERFIRGDIAAKVRSKVSCPVITVMLPARQAAER